MIGSPLARQSPQIIPDLSTEYWLGLGTGFFSIVAGLFFYYFIRQKLGGGRPIGGQDASIQTDAPVYHDATLPFGPWRVDTLAKGVGYQYLIMGWMLL